MNKTIKCSNVELKPDEGYGESVKIGYKTPEGWENYYCSDPTLFGYFEKGQSVTIEYHQNKGKSYFNIDGVSEAARPAQSTAKSNSTGGGGFAPVEDAGKQKSIELQVVVKAAAEMFAGQSITAGDFAAWVVGVWTDVFAPPLDALKQQAQQALDAEDDEDIPF